MIDHTFLKNLINKPVSLSDLDFDQISNILESATKLFENENLLLEFNLEGKGKKIYVIGDIHGNLETLIKILEMIDSNNPDVVIFLGDIVDRGPKQLECLLLVLILKILNPQKYYLLRGNHETLEMNQYYGFYQYFIDRFKEPGKFNEILAVYNVLPLCTLVNNTILCLHGGIPQDTEILQKIKGKKTKNLSEIFNSISNSLIQIMWNDPKEKLKGFTDSFRGNGIKFFGEDVFERFLKNNNLKLLIRAHECFPEGFKWFFHKRLLSIFSSANYRGNFSPNPASFAVIDNNEIKLEIMKL
ncbi:MAG: metallophosphoesterase [Promethearchaeota archaeon]